MRGISILGFVRQVGSPKTLACLSSSCSEALELGGLRSLFTTSSWQHAFPSDSDVHSTTVLCVRKDGDVVLVADGQVTMGGTVVKPNVRKTRRIGEHAIGGFAGATADAFTLFERLETKLEEHPGGSLFPEVFEYFGLECLARENPDAHR